MCYALLPNELVTAFCSAGIQSDEQNYQNTLQKKASHQRLAGKLQSLNDSSYKRRYRGNLRRSKIQKCQQANNKQAPHIRNKL